MGKVVVPKEEQPEDEVVSRNNYYCWVPLGLHNQVHDDDDGPVNTRFVVFWPRMGVLPAYEDDDPPVFVWVAAWIPTGIRVFVFCPPNARTRRSKHGGVLPIAAGGAVVNLVLLETRDSRETAEVPWHYPTQWSLSKRIVP